MVLDKSDCLIILSFRLRDNSVHFHEYSPFFGRYFYNMYILNMFEIVFSFNVKDNNIFPCLHNIRLSDQCFVRMRMST